MEFGGGCRHRAVVLMVMCGSRSGNIRPLKDAARLVTPDLIAAIISGSGSSDGYSGLGELKTMAHSSAPR